MSAQFMHTPLTRRRFLKGCSSVATAVIGGGLLAGCAQESSPSPTINDVAQMILDEMSIEEKVSQLFFVTPEQLVGIELMHEPGQLKTDSLQIPPPGGVIFFASNLENTEQASSLLSGLQDFMKNETPIPLFLGTDEEGGPVQRVGGREGFDAPFVSSMSEIGALNDESEARKAARTIASNLRSLGFNTDFAPSCDISTSSSSALYKRSFGAEADLVSLMAVAQIETFNEEGILCCAKHFPGIGDPEEDSHTSTIASNKTREELEEQMLPFASAIDAGVPFVMVGHLSLPQILGSNTPSSISSEIIQGILRDDLGFEGVILTDSLSMGALDEFCSKEDRAIAAIEAGCDMVLMPPELVPAYVNLLNAVNTGRITEERLDASLKRILTLKLRAFPDLFDESVQDALAECV